MKTPALAVIALALTTALPAFADPQRWLTHCNRVFHCNAPVADQAVCVRCA